MATLEQVVQPLPLAAPRLSLLASITVHEGSDADARVIGDRWRENALTFTPEPCGGEGGVFDPTCNGPVVDISGGKSTVGAAQHFQGFGVFEPESCSTFGRAGVDTDERARRAITLDEAKQVEKELWTGTLAQAAGFTTNKWLARNGVVTQLNGGAATALVRALADLEMAIAAARSGGRCIIHATRLTVTHWLGAGGGGLLYRQGNVLLTVASDTIVIPGEGYPGTDPTGGALPGNHNTAWAYATGPIEAFRGSVEMVTPASPELTSNNRRTSIAKRIYALEIDPCVYVGINITHPNT